MTRTHSKADVKLITFKILDVLVQIITSVASAPYYILLQRGTRDPLQRILQSRTDSEARTVLEQWRKYKVREAAYVQVAGAVMFASVTSCLQWPFTTNTHWSGPALWLASIILAIASILTGAQQTLVLSTDDTPTNLTTAEIQAMRFSLSFRNQSKLSASVLFTWQIPIMLLCYSVLCFLAGLCSIVYSPLARNLTWNDQSKTASVFSVAAVVCLGSWGMASLFVFRLQISGHLMLDSKVT